MKTYYQKRDELIARFEALGVVITGDRTNISYMEWEELWALCSDAGREAKYMELKEDWDVNQLEEPL